VIRVVGASAMPMWITYDRDYISGQFDFEVEGGSTQPNNESFRRQSALQLMDAMAPFLGTVVDPVALARKVLQDGFGIKDASQFLVGGGLPPAPDQGMGGEEQMMLPPGGEEMDAEMNADPQASMIPGIPQNLLNRLNVEPSPAQF
jgi:hypothetical protein